MADTPTRDRSSRVRTELVDHFRVFEQPVERVERVLSLEGPRGGGPQEPDHIRRTPWPPRRELREPSRSSG
jgi:hypothetical protein